MSIKELGVHSRLEASNHVNQHPQIMEIKGKQISQQNNRHHVSPMK
jgi:hypothetical protein